MGQWSKATLAWLNNFSKPINPQNPTVEEVFDDENTHFEDKDEDFLEHGFFFLDEEQQPGEDLDDSDSDEEVDEEELNELKNEADIEHFNAVLAQAQAMAVKAERKAAGEKLKHKRHYMGNSACTKWHHAQRHRELAVTGQKLISSMFTTRQQKTTLPPEENETPPDIQAVEVIDDSDPSDVDDDDIEEALKQLFPSECAVSILKA